MRTEFFLAGKYLRPKRNEVSINTIISVIGVTLGVAVLIVVLAVMTGFGSEMRKKLLQTQNHLAVAASSGYVMENLAAPKEAILASGGRTAAAMIMAPVMLQRGKSFIPFSAMGIEFEEFAREMDMEEAILSHLRPGAPYELRPGEVIISTNTASELGLTPGSRVLIHSSAALAELVEVSESGGISVKASRAVALPAEYTVGALYHFGKSNFDESFVFMELNDAAELFRLPWNSATHVAGWVDDPDNIAHYRGTLAEKLGRGYSVTTWQDRNRTLLNVLDTEKQMMFFLLIFIVLVAAFSISNNLITSVYQKTREIGLLKAIGATNASIMRIFIFQGLLVGFIGTGCGVALGCAVVKFRTEIMAAMAAVTGREMFPKEFYIFDTLPAVITAHDLIAVAATSILLCTLGGVFPAWRAAKLDPAKAFRNE